MQLWRAALRGRLWYSTPPHIYEIQSSLIDRFARCVLKCEYATLRFKLELGRQLRPYRYAVLHQPTTAKNDPTAHRVMVMSE